MDSDPGGALRRAILGSESARLDAMMTGDLAVLGKMFHDSLSYVHSAGRCDSKESLLQFISEGSVRYLGIEHDLGKVWSAAQGLAIATGTMAMRLVAGGTEKSLATRTTNIWIRGTGGWQLAAFHATATAT